MPADFPGQGWCSVLPSSPSPINGLQRSSIRNERTMRMSNVDEVWAVEDGCVSGREHFHRKFPCCHLQPPAAERRGFSVFGKDSAAAQHLSTCRPGRGTRQVPARTNGPHVSLAAEADLTFATSERWHRSLHKTADTRLLGAWPPLTKRLIQHALTAGREVGRGWTARWGMERGWWAVVG